MERPRNTHTETFPNKIRAVIRAGRAGVFGTNPPSEIDSIFRQSYGTTENPYISPRAYPNPPLELLEHEVMQKVLKSTSTNVNTLPWTNHRFSQGYHLALMEAWTDMHKQRIPKEHVVPELSRGFVDQVVTLSDQRNRQITIPEQLSVAMDLADGSVLGAAVIAHAGTRSIARGSDTRLNERFRYSIDEIKHWRDCISSFEAISGSYSDPTADTYHFWGTFVAGLLSEIGDRKRDKLFNPLYRIIYTNMHSAIKTLRYGLVRKSGETHPQADLVGYHLGSMTGATLATRIVK